MTPRRVAVEAYEYEFVADDAPLVAHRDWAIASAQVVDDIDDAPLTVPIRVRIVIPGIRDEIAQDGTVVRRIERAIVVKRGSEGTFALVTRPWLRFTPFGAPTTVNVVVEAEGFVAMTQSFTVAYDQCAIAAPAPLAGVTDVTLISVTPNAIDGLAAGQTLLFGPAASPQYVRIRKVVAPGQVVLEAGLLQGHGLGEVVFPNTFVSPPPVRLRMRRIPVRIAGRVVSRKTSTGISTPIFNASIAITDFWRTRADILANPTDGAMKNPVLALRQFAVAVAPGALAARSAGAMAGPFALLPVAADDKLLVRAAIGGTQSLRVTDSVNLLAPGPLTNRLIQIDADDPQAAEYQTLATVTLSGAPVEPADLTLDLPLQFPHAPGVRVSLTNAPAALPATTCTLRDSAMPSDRCLFVDSLATLPVADALYLTGGGAIDEFQQFSPLATTSDAEGYFALPPLQRIARIELTVIDGVNVQTLEVDPDYTEPEQWLEIVYLV